MYVVHENFHWTFVARQATFFLMEFEQWLGGYNRQTIADELGVHRMTVNRYARGQIMPRPEMVEAIRNLTGGAVTADDLAASYNRTRQ